MGTVLRGKYVVAIVAGVSGALSVACSGQAADDAASAAVTSTLQSLSSGATHELAQIDLQSTSAPVDAATWLEDHGKQAFLPDGCARTAREAAVVTFHLDHCTGPGRQAVIDGALRFAFSQVEAGQLRVDVTGEEGLTLHGSPYAYVADGVLRRAGDRTELDWHASSSGTTKRGREFEHETRYTARFDRATRCLSLSGTLEARVDRTELEIRAEGLEVCEQSCPKSGRLEAELKGRRGKLEASVEFDGTDRVSVTGPRGRTRRVAIACGDGEAADDAPEAESAAPEANSSEAADGSERASVPSSSEVDR